MSNEIVSNGPYTGKIVIHSSVIEEVSKYPNALDAIREYIANAWDADADRLEITVNDNSLRIEDWGTGIANFDLFWGVADQHKAAIELTPKFGRKPIGRKGLGKLSFAMLGNKITVETRTPYKAEYSYADFDKMEFYGFPRGKIDEVLSHKGSQITIRELKIELKKDEIIEYIKENLYGLILPIACKDNPMRVFVNGEKVVPRQITGTSGIISTPFGDIHCNLTPNKTSKIDALYRGVKVREVNPAPTHPAKGYFTVDWVTPTPDRSNFTDSEEARLFFLEIKKYVLRNIPAKSEDSPKDLEKSLREVSRLFDQILRDMGMLPQTMMPVSRTSKPSDLQLGGIAEKDTTTNEETIEKEKQESEIERKRLQHKILKGEDRPLKSAYGINYAARKLGKDKPAIVSYKEEKLIIINLDHDLVKNIHNLHPNQKNIALGFLIARGHFHILESFKTIVSYEEFIDSMITTLLTKMKVTE
jgi:HSP90 family molecular chaperone